MFSCAPAVRTGYAAEFASVCLAVSRKTVEKVVYRLRWNYLGPELISGS